MSQTEVQLSVRDKFSISLPVTPTLTSREALGVWRKDNYSFKVFASRNQFDKLQADYDRAAVQAALPTGNPSFVLCKVKRGTKSDDGFFIKMRWLEGTNFLKGTIRPLAGALEEQKVSHNPNDTTYVKIKHGCEAAALVGLMDCQGFVNVKNSSEPIIFLDVHTSYTPNAPTMFGPSAEALAIRDVVYGWVAAH